MKSAKVLVLAGIIGLMCAISAQTGNGIWTPLLGPSNQPVASVAVAPGHPEVVYCTPSRHYSDPYSDVCYGVGKSTNGGVTWSHISLPETLVVGRSLAISPLKEQILLLGTMGGSWSRGIHKTTDGGATWSYRYRVQASGPDVRKIVFNPIDPTTVYAAVGSVSAVIESCGVLKSTDSGETWGFCYADDSTCGCLDLAINPQDPQILYTACPWGVSQQGFYKTTNGGSTWVQKNYGLVGDPSAVAVCANPVHPDTVYGVTTNLGVYRVYRSADAGENWVLVHEDTGPQQPGTCLVVDPLGNVYFCLAGRGIFKSTDAGVSWMPKNNGLSDWWTDGVALDPNNSLTLYCGTWTGGSMYKSTDGGEHWVNMVNGFPRSIVNDVVVNPTDGSIYAGTQDWLSGHGRLYRSPKNGNDWHLFGHNPDSLGFSFGGVLAIAVDPLDTLKVYFLGEVENQLPPPVTFSIFVRTTDGGRTWSQSSFNWDGHNSHDIQVDPLNPQTIWVATSDEYLRTFQLQKSTDGGVSFQGVVVNSTAPSSPRHIVIDPTDPNTIYVTFESGLSSRRGVFKTTDGGAIWSRILNSRTHPICLDRRVPTTLWVGAYGGIFKTTDGGANWALCGLAGDTVLSLLWDPRNANLYAGTNRKGVFESSDGGVTWSRFNEGFATDSLQILEMAMDSAQHILYAAILGTARGGGAGTQTDSTVGVWSYQMYSGIEEAEPNQTGAFELRLFPAKPNPAKKVAYITYSLPAEDRASLKVYNLTGQAVRTLVDERVSAGLHSVAWDGRDQRGRPVSSGVYFFRLETYEGARIQKLVMVR